MANAQRWWRRFWDAARPEWHVAEIDEELAFHLEIAAEARRETGLDEEGAGSVRWGQLVGRVFGFA